MLTFKVLRFTVFFSVLVWCQQVIKSNADVTYDDHGETASAKTATDSEVEPRIVSIFPKTGSEFGGTKLTIKGYGFHTLSEPLQCCFNETSVPSIYVSDGEVHCDTPPSMPGTVIVSFCPSRIGNSESKHEHDTNSSDTFTYTIMATVFSLTPSYGSGGNSVEIIGSGFLNSSSLCCRFNQTVAPATFMSSSRIKCLAPNVESGHMYSIVTVSNNGIDVEGDWASVKFMYYPTPTITTIDPIVAPSSGGTNLFVRGNNFPYNETNRLTICKFGDILVNATVLDRDEIVCTTPQISVLIATIISVEVSTNGGYEFHKGVEAKLIVHPPVILQKVIPDTVPETGGTTVSVFGDHFHDNPSLECKFGSITVPASWVSNTLVNCTVPPSRIGIVDLRVSTNGQNAGLSPGSLQFTFVDAVTLTSIKPKSGPFVGGTLINLFGTGFQHSPAFMCRFGNIETTSVQIINKTAAQCIAPNSTFTTDTTVSIDVSVNKGHDFTSSDLSFVYKQMGKIDSIIPRSGPSVGNTELSILGNFSKFEENQILCHFTNNDGIDLTSEIIEMSQQKIRCLTPRIKLASLDPHVTMFINLIDVDDNAKVPLTTEAGLFTYYPPTQLTRLEPDIGSELGGTDVTVVGRFTRSNDLFCKFGEEVSLSVQWISKQKIKCQSPPATEDFLQSPIVPVTILTNGVDDEGISLPYHYIIASHVSTATPTFGSLSGGTPVVVEGSGFPIQIPNVKALCSFGDILVDATVLSESVIKCKSPPSELGAVKLSVSFNQGYEYISSSAFFTFIKSPTITSISPTFVTSGESIEIRLVGENFYESRLHNQLALCQLGNLTMKAHIVNESLITFDSQAVQDRINSRVKISLNGADFTPFGPTFSVYTPPSIKSISPNFSYEYGGVSISIQGGGFYNLPFFSCIFTFNVGEKVIKKAEYLTYSSAKCTTPPMNSHFTQNVKVELTLSGKSSPVNPTFNISYYTGISITSVFPSVFPKGGGSKVSIHGYGFHQQKKPYVCKIDEPNFGSIYVQADYFSHDILNCHVPPSQHLTKGSTSATLSIGVFHNEKYYEIGTQKDCRNLTYHDDIVLHSVTPNTGSIIGGSNVVLLGENFMDSISTSCSFSLGDIRYVLPARFRSRDSISCSVPTFPFSTMRGKSVAMVQASNNGLDFSVSSLPFHYQVQMSIDSIHPILFEENVQSNISVYGSGFFNCEELNCVFSNGIYKEQSSATCISHRVIQCKSPHSIAPGAYSLTVRTFNVFSVNVLTITVYPQIIIRDIATIPVHSCEEYRVKVIGLFPNTTMLQCKFDNIISNVTFVSNTEIECSTPILQRRISNENATTISISGNARDFVHGQMLLTNENFYSCLESPSTQSNTSDFSPFFEIQSIYPEKGTIEGNHTVQLQGSGFTFHFNASCRFGLRVSQARILTTNRLECRVPEAHHPGIVNVDVTLDGELWVTSGLKYEYLPLIRLLHVEPKYIPTHGGTIVHVTATKINLNHRVFCSFGIAGTVQAVVLSSTFLTCISPVASNEGPFAFDLFIGDKTISSNGPMKLEFIDRAPFTIFPKFGPIEGNSLLSFSFDTQLRKSLDVGSFFCTFNMTGGETVQTEIKRSGENAYNCLTPNITHIFKNGQKEMILSHLHIKSACGNFTMTESAQAFTFKSTPQKISMVTKIGDLKGGTVVSLVTGSNQDLFINSDSLMCKFGTALARVKWISKHEIQCITPPHNESDGFEVQVFLAENGIDYTFVGSFSYIATPSISQPFVNYVYTKASSRLNIPVTGLVHFDRPACMFQKDDKKWFIPGFLMNETLLQCSVPLLEAGESIHVHVSNNGQEFSNARTSLVQFFDSPKVTSIEPNSGMSEKTTLISLNGLNFIESILWYCEMVGGDYIYTSVAHSVTKTVVLCDVKCPQVVSLTTFQVTLISDHGQHGISPAVVFECYPAPKISSVSPSSFYAQNEQKLQIFGDYFPQHYEFDCVFFGSFGQLKSNARRINDSTATCTTPKILIPETIDFGISPRNGVNVGDNFIQLNAIPPVLISHVEEQSILPISGFKIMGYFGTLLDAANCRLGMKYVGKIHRLESENSVNCTFSSKIPRSNYSEIEIVFADSVISSYRSLIHVYNPPLINEISPSQVLRLFKSTITIWGNWFDFGIVNAYCWFDGLVSSPAIVISAQLIHCETPLLPVAKKVDIDVTFGQISRSNALPVDFVDPWEIHKILPCSGSIKGGTNIEIIGGTINTNLELGCLFDDSVLVKATLKSNFSIQCETPRMDYPKKVHVSVALFKSAQIISVVSESHYEESDNSNSFYFFDEGTIAGAIPSSSALNGGSEVVIKGTWTYHEDCLRCLVPTCSFGVTKTTGKILPTNNIRCTSPALPRSIHDTSNVSLRVSLNGFDLVKGSVEFSYTKEMDLIRIIPNHGSMQGGTRVSLIGVDRALYVNLDIQCRFGSYPTMYALYDNRTNEVFCHTPAAEEPATVPLLLKYNFDDTWRETGKEFHYEQDFFVSEISSNILHHHHDSILIKGWGFEKSSDLVCNFGQQSNTKVHYINSNLVSCTLPQDVEKTYTHFEGSISFFVASSNRQYSSKSFSIDYKKNRAVLSQIHPIIGPSYGGTLINIEGENFNEDDELLCWFDDHATSANFVSRSLMSCESSGVFLGTHELVKKVVFTLSRTSPSQSSFKSHVSFFFHKVWSKADVQMYPTRGPSTGGTKVTISGEVFSAMKPFHSTFCMDANVKILFGGFIVDATCVNDSIIFITPSKAEKSSSWHDGEDLIPISISLNSGLDYIPLPGFTVYENPEIVAVRPSVILNGYHDSVWVDVVASPTKAEVLCKIGTFASQGRFVSSSAIKCPLRHHERIDLGINKLIFASLSLNNQDFVTSSTPILVQAAPNIFYLNPKYVSTHGGTIVKVTGINFLSLRSSKCSICLVGKSPHFEHCVAIIVHNDSLFSFEAPEGFGTNIRLQYVCNGDLFDATNSTLTFIPSVQMTSMEPSSGHWNIGHLIKISGRHIMKGFEYSCLFTASGIPSSINASVTVDHDSSIICEIPSAKEIFGRDVEEITVDVQVKRHVDRSVSNKSPFYFRNDDTLMWEPEQPPSLEPFELEKSLTKTQIQCTSSERKSRKRLLQTQKMNQNNIPNFVDVSVYPNNSFVPDTEIKIESIDNNSGSVRGGTKLRVFGRGFTKVRDVSCFFASRKTHAKIQNDSWALCHSPPMSTLFHSLHLNRTEQSWNVPLAVNLQSDFQNMDGVLHNHNSLKSSRQDMEKFTKITMMSSFTYTESERIHSLIPQSSSLAGNEKIRVIGDGFIDSPNLSCMVGSSKPKKAVFLNRTTVDCIIPPAYEAVAEHFLNDAQEKLIKVFLSVSNNGEDFSLNLPRNFASLSYFKNPIILDVRPLRGGVGTFVYISVISLPLTEDLQCRLGDKSVKAEVVSESTLVCNAPAQEMTTNTKKVKIDITLNGYHFTHSQFYFEYVETPIVHNITPSAGPTIGGNLVKVKGLNFHSAAIKCRFDQIFTHATIIDDTTLHCDVPPRVAGKVQFSLFDLVSLTHNFTVKSSNLQLHSEIVYSYFEEYELFQIFPEFGSIAGNTLVKVSGKNFHYLEGLACVFGNTTTIATYISSEEVECYSPPFNNVGVSPTLLKLGILNEMGITMLSASKSQTYSFVKISFIDQIFPGRGFSCGGDKVKLVGVNFYQPPDNKVICAFGNAKTIGEWISSTEIECVTPSIPSLSKNISGSQIRELQLSLNGVDYFSGLNGKAIPFIFDHNIMVENVMPSHGSINGGTSVILTGKGFSLLKNMNIQTIFCVFGAEETIGTLLHHEQIKCSTPTFAAPAKVLATIELYSDVEGQGRKVESRATFEYLNEPEILHIYPEFFSIMDSKSDWGQIEVYGNNFIDSPDLACYYIHTKKDDGILKSSFQTRASFFNATFLRCKIEGHNFNAAHWRDSVVLHVTTNGIDTSNGHLIELAQMHQVNSIFPVLGPLNGGTMLHIHGKNFVDSKFLTCKFGSLPPVQAHFRTTQALLCTTPSFRDWNDTSINVHVSNNGYHFSSTAALFRIHETIQILSIHPKIGPSRGGTNVAVNLASVSEKRSDDDEYVCRFNETHVPATIMDSGRLYVSCVSPPSYGHGGIVPFEISLNGVDFTFSNLKFEYLPGLQSESIFISPSHGPIHGGTLVEISGLSKNMDIVKNFQISEASPLPLCKFGDMVVPAEEYSIRNEDLISCQSPAFTRNDFETSVVVDVSLTGAFEDFLGVGALFRYDDIISVAEINPTTGPTTGGTPTQVIGGPFPKNVKSEILCAFCNDTVPAAWKSEIEIACISPEQQNLNVTRICPLKVSLNNGADFSENSGSFSFQPLMKVVEIHPSHGMAGSKIAVHGENFASNKELFCHFGDSDYITNDSRYRYHSTGVSAAFYINETDIVCKAPPKGVFGLVPFFISIDGMEMEHGRGNHFFRYDDPIIIEKIFPSAGPSSGNFLVRIFGGTFLSPNYQYCCKFGSAVVDAVFISEKEIKCNAPAHVPGLYELTISQNGQDFSAEFKNIHLYEDIELFGLYPVSGPARNAGTIVKVFGRNFLNTTSAMCKFDGKPVPIRYNSPTEIECVSPALFGDEDLNWEPLGHHENFQSKLFDQSHDYPLYLSRGVQVEVSMNAQDFSKSGLKFVYQNDIILYGLNIEQGPSSGGTPILVSGSGFTNVTSLACRFGHYIRGATFLTRNLVLCFSPPLSDTYRYSDSYKSSIENHEYKTGPNAQNSSVYVEVSNNGVDFTDYHLMFHYQKDTQGGLYQPGVEINTILTCPKGAYCLPSTLTYNFTLCPKGTFQPLPGQQQCSRCPIGFICPEEGLPVPRICPAGFVCDVTGIEDAAQPCPAGFFCPIGTVTSITYCGLGDSSSPSNQGTKMSISQTLGELSTTIRDGYLPLGLDMVAGGRNSFCWDNSTEDYGLQTSEFPGQFWDEMRILPLDLDSPSVPTRGRFCEDDACLRVKTSFSSSISDYFSGYTNSTLKPQRPIPCTHGSYCHPGTSNNISIDSYTHSSPQICSGGNRYCPEASTTPFGSSKCPLGHYCRFGKKALCPVGTYCPSTNLWDPLPCEPGTFNYMLGQTNCTTCPDGHFCSGYGRVDPGLCTPGFVCSRTGLSSPNIQCPAGFYCPPGTRTSDPFRNDTTLRPYACSPGSYCLSGVGFSSVVEGNFSHAQPCPPGFFCESASTSATGSGLCPPGFYCPKGTATPRPTPKGHYAKLYGTVKSSTCLPGFYAPTIENSECIPCPPGTSCETEGLFAADVCPPGTFRSTKEKDDITCQTCPQGTWSKNWHLRDQSECTICPTGLYCPIDGMTNPCSRKDLPMPFEPVLNLNGVPVLEYKFNSANAPPAFSIDECLQLNFDGGSDFKPLNDQHFFFGELVPPYIDILGRGAHIRITDEKSSIYGKGVQCYRNLSPQGSTLFQRMTNFYGPQYDIQRGYPHQGYALNDNVNSMFRVESNSAFAFETSYLYGLGMMFVDLPLIKKFDPYLNCTHGFNLMNSTLKQSEEVVYTSAKYDFEGGRDVKRCDSFDAFLNCHIDPTYQLHSKGECCHINKWTQRAIFLAADQYYPGTCEADIICNEERVSEAVSCQDGFVCSEQSTSISSTSTACPPGYVCSFGATTDASLLAPNGKFTNICPAGNFCRDGTGLKVEDNQCPIGFICPSGTSDPLMGLLANDGLNRHFEVSGDVDFHRNMKNLVYFGGDRFQLLSDHESRCLSGIDPALHHRYIVDNDAEFYNKRSWISVLQNNETSIKMTTKFKSKCARDNKWNIISDVVSRSDCDCNSQLFLLFAVYRLWKCSLRNTEETVCEWPDSTVISPTAGKIPYIAEYLGDGNGGRDISPKPRSFLPYQSKGFLKLRNYGSQNNPDFRFEVKYNNENLRVFRNYWHLSKEVESDFATEMDHSIYDLYHIVQIVNQFGDVLEDISFFRKEELNDNPIHHITIQHTKSSKPVTLVPLRLDICNCKNALKCPDGTTTISVESTESGDCVWNGFEKLDRISLLPSIANQSVYVKNASDFGELGNDVQFPVGTLILKPYEVAVFDLNLTGLPRNLTYGNDFEIAIYEDCKPCPPHYHCKNDNKCSRPSLKSQFEVFNQCLRKFRKKVCVHKNGTSVATRWCSEEAKKIKGNSVDANFLLYTEPDLHKCLSIPFFCDDREWEYMTFRKLCKDGLDEPVYNCTDVVKWEHYQTWRDNVCCSDNPEFKNLQSCLNNTCSNHPMIQKILQEKFIKDYVIENDFQPPKMKPKGIFFMDETLQEDALNPNPLSLFDKWNSETKWKRTNSCCRCKPRRRPIYYKGNIRDSGYPDDKHREIKLVLSAVKKVDITIVVELLHGKFSNHFSTYFHQDSHRELHIHKPTRFESSSKSSMWLAILDRATLNEIPSELPLNLPIRREKDSVRFENSFLIDEPCEEIISVAKRRNDSPDINEENSKIQHPHDDDGLQKRQFCASENPVVFDDSWWENNVDSKGDQTTELSFIALPYFPFFSSCSGFDSHIGISRMLEEHPDCSLVPPEGTQPVRQLSFSGQNSPVGDVCMLEKIDDTGHTRKHGISLECSYEEQVSMSSNKYRWFEAEAGETLFYITNDPIKAELFQAQLHESGNAAQWGTSTLISQYSKIPVTIDAVYSGVKNVIPRRVLLQLQYFQVNTYKKRLVDAKLSFFDSCTVLKPEYFGGDPEMLRKMEKQNIFPCETDYNGNLRSYDYELEILYEPLDWFHLLNRFQFETPIYLGFYTLAGMTSVFLSVIIWGINKAMTKLRHPPKFHGTSLLKLIGSPSIFGCSLAAVGILSCSLITHFWVNMLRTSSQTIKGYWYTLTLDHDDSDTKEKGRSGLILVAVGYFILLSGASMMIPNRSDRQASVAIGVENNVDTVPDGGDNGPWKPRQWKRTHFILNAISLQLLLLVFWEFTYSPLFGRSLHFYIILMKTLQISMEMLLMKILKEKLLCIPLLVLVGLTEMFIAMAASNFIEFIITYFVHIALSVVHKIYIDPILKGIQSLFPRWKHSIAQKLYTRRKSSVKAKKEEEDRKKKIDEEIELRNEGVDPLIDALTQSSIHMITRFLSPCAFLLIRLFNNFSDIATNYGINNHELTYYALFAFNMIPWSTAVDVFVLNSQELVHGWRLYDYLEYQRHRFCSRERRWTLGSQTVDESVTQNLQSIDSMSFSSQYYFLVTYLSSGMFVSMLGLTILLRAPDYNVFGDPAMPLIVTFIFANCNLCQFLIKSLASVQIDYLDWRGIWGATQLEGTLDDVIAAKLAIGEGRQVDLEQERMELEAMNDEKFRKRFLDRNRPWVLQHIYELFTTGSDSKSVSLDRSNLIKNAKDMYNLVEGMASSSEKVEKDIVDLSSDDESLDESNLFESWDTLTIKGSSLEVAKLWLKLARKRRVFFNEISDQIKCNMNSSCSSCSRPGMMCHTMNSYLARNGKKDSTVINDLIAQFEKIHPSQQNDLGLWKSFFRKNAEIITLCNFCIDAGRNGTKPNDADLIKKRAPTRAGDISSDDENDDINTSLFQPMIIDKDSVHGHLVGKWLNAARLKLGGHFPRSGAKSFAETYIDRMRYQTFQKRKLVQYGDNMRHEDGSETNWDRVQLDEAGKKIISKWVATARKNT